MKGDRLIKFLEKNYGEIDDELKEAIRKYYSEIFEIKVGNKKYKVVKRGKTFYVGSLSFQFRKSSIEIFLDGRYYASIYLETDIPEEIIKNIDDRIDDYNRNIKSDKRALRVLQILKNRHKTLRRDLRRIEKKYKIKFDTINLASIYYINIVRGLNNKKIKDAINWYEDSIKDAKNKIKSLEILREIVNQFY